MAARYSHSRLNSYFQCPLRYKFAYIDRIKTDAQGIEAFMGSRVHSALEQLYKDKMMAKENSLDDVIDYYNNDWKKNWHDKIQIVKKEYTADNYKEIGRQSLAEYYNRYAPFDDGKTIGLEIFLDIDLNNDKKYCLVGVVDRLVAKDGGIYEIHDYKTSNKLPTQEELDKDNQLALYQLGVESKWPDAKEVDLIWHMVRFDKEVRSKRKNEDLDKLKKLIINQIETIEAAVSEGKFEPCESALCNWCDYQELCPKRKHLYKAMPLEPNEYLKEEGVTLVNKYVMAKEEKKNLTAEKDSEIAKIEEALLALAKKEGYDAIAGSDNQVNINFGPRFTYPTKTKSPEFREALEEIVRKLGIWDEVSDLSGTKLSSVIKNNGLNEEQIKEIKKLLILDERPKFSVKKIKKSD